LALLQELEASLEATQQAVLARDWAGLDQGTREQMRLHRAFKTVWAQFETHPPGIAENGRGPLEQEPQLAAELRAAGKRVLDLGRVQRALLVRAERSLRMMANLLAGPGSSYSPGPVQIPPRPPANDPGEKLPCRA